MVTEFVSHDHKKVTDDVTIVRSSIHFSKGYGQQIWTVELARDTKFLLRMVESLFLPS